MDKLHELHNCNSSYIDATHCISIITLSKQFIFNFMQLHYNCTHDVILMSLIIIHLLKFDGYIHKYKSHKNCNECFVVHVFVSKFVLILHILKICFDDNVFTILWKHVQ
jgi:hypothetical protein